MNTVQLDFIPNSFYDDTIQPLFQTQNDGRGPLSLQFKESGYEAVNAPKNLGSALIYVIINFLLMIFFALLYFLSKKIEW